MANAPSNVLIDIRPGEFLTLAGVVTVELVHKSGRVARLRVTAPRDMAIKKQLNSDQDRRDATQRQTV